MTIAEVNEPEYPVASTIWTTLHDDYGLSEYVCAGILGNIMVEAGGSTLEIKADAESKNYYGVCQWSKKYYPEVYGASLDEQCDYLMSNIEAIFRTFGKRYKKSFTYEDFLALTDERDAALAFAKCYERCSSGGYERRKDCATTAYEYFKEDLE